VSLYSTIPTLHRTPPGVDVGCSFISGFSVNLVLTFCRSSYCRCFRFPWVMSPPLDLVKTQKKFAHNISQYHVRHLVKADFQALLLVQTESVYLISNNSWTTLVGTHVAAFGSPIYWRGAPPSPNNCISPFFAYARTRTYLLK
jgi:hypothetical protein